MIQKRFFFEKSKKLYIRILKFEKLIKFEHPPNLFPLSLLSFSPHLLFFLSFFSFFLFFPISLPFSSNQPRSNHPQRSAHPGAAYPDATHPSAVQLGARCNLAREAPGAHDTKSIAPGAQS